MRQKGLIKEKVSLKKKFSEDFETYNSQDQDDNIPEPEIIREDDKQHMEVEEEREVQFAEPVMYDPTQISPSKPVVIEGRKKSEEESVTSIFSDYSSEEEKKK